MAIKMHKINTVLYGLLFTAASSVQAEVGSLIWEDNFNNLNPDSWHVDVGDGCDQGLCGWGNQELQWYGESNTYIADVPGEAGNKALVLEARTEASNGYGFTSGKVESSDKIAVQYGMIEVRMQVPDVGTGLWPAAWMLGTTTQAWPAKGEIDMMEMGHKDSARVEAGFPGADINSYVGSNLIFYTDAACSTGNPTCAASTAYQNDNAHVSTSPLINRFVTYRTYWTDTSIRFTVEDNGVEHDMYDAPFIISEESSEFQAPFYLLLNLAVGGNFTDAATNSQVNAPTPAKMYIDYVRVYELDGQGQVFIGNQTVPEAGTFGVFTDNTPTNNKLVTGQDSDIYVWNQNAVVNGNIAAVEGDNVIAWNYTSSNEWFGGGINSRQARDMSNFADSGEMSFKIKIPADVSFKVGIADTYTNQNWIEFPANTTTYGLVRNGDWATATIPAADLGGSLVALQSLEGMFYIASVDGALPSGSFQMAIDDIVWTGGGDVVNTDSDGDGVADIVDNCANTPAGAVVDANGCEVIVVVDTDNDGVIDDNDLCPNTLTGVAVDATGCALIIAQSELIQAEDYTNFSDTTSNNIGGQYRSDAVDIEATNDNDSETNTSGGYNVGWIEAGETLDYTLELGAGTYDLSTRVASATNGSYTLTVDGQTVGSDSVATGGWQTFQTHNLGSVEVTAGDHTIRVTADSGNFNLNWVNVELTAVTPIDADNDGVLDDVDQCLGSAAGAIVDETGCEVIIPVDADNDGVLDDGTDQCLGTAAGVTVDAVGCEVVVSEKLGVMASSATSVDFFVNVSGWADVHYVLNGAGQQNFRMTNTGSGNVKSLDNLSDGDVIAYAFTYLDDDGSVKVADWASYTFGAVSVPDSDNDSVADNIDLCPNTTSGAAVNSVGCPDSDADNVFDNIDQCPGTIAGTVVDSVGCAVIFDADSDGVIDNIDQCANTPQGASVNSVGCPDSDHDGVFDNIDQCSDTAAGTAVDATGCAVVTQEFGITQTSSSSVQFFVDTINFADVHYKKNDGGQQNLGMSLVNGQRIYDLSGLVDGDTLDYSYTYQPNSGSVTDTDFIRFTVGGIIDGDDDNDTVLNSVDQCTDTPAGAAVNSVGCPDTDSDSVFDNIDQCANTPLGASVNAVGCIIDNADDDNDLVINTNDQCPNTPLGVVVNSVGCPDTDSDGVFDNIDQCPNSPIGNTVNSLGCPSISTGDITALYDGSTVLEGTHQEDTGEALITRYGDRPRTRHAKEDHFQAYDHYIAHYFERRSSSMEIIDRVAKGGEGITLNVRTVWPISTQREGRIWYMGWGTVADYIDNSLMEIDTTRGDINGFDGSHFHYTKTVTTNPRKSPTNLNTSGGGALGPHNDSPPIELGDLMEFEVSQFSGTKNGEIIGGQTNYYGSTFLYVVGTGIVPWYTENTGEWSYASAHSAHYQEDSRELPEEYRLGGDTTVAYQYTHEPDNYFMQMALNIDYNKSQKFLEGRRVFHSNFTDGHHDEFVDNGTFADVTGLIGAHHVNESCSGCHVRNGGSSVEANGVPLDRWIFKIGDASGAKDANRGRVIQPSNTSGSGEGTVSIAEWTELGNGLRTPTFDFESGQPAQFSARITPRLVGLGLLEAIKETDILALEQAQQNSNDGISGRANLVTDPKNPALTRIGRFGWKASTVSVEHQVAGALNTDMGVKTSVLPDLDCGSNQGDCNSGAPALDDTNLDKLVYYVQALAVRAQRGLESGVEDQSIKAGKQTFVDVGCASCHTPSFQTSEFHPLVEVRDQAIQPYTDLLVHDMGDGLADNLAEGSVSGREWRTTPLWGLGLSMCVTNGVINPQGGEGNEVCNEAPGGTYLHDGRARTIEEAILWHGTTGSEALSSTNNYKALSATDKANLHNFLEAL